jgi:hypothetical protein
MVTRALAICILTAACRPDVKPAKSAPQLSGTAVLVAPITGAQIRVVRLDVNAGEVVGTTTTDEEGNFTVELRETEGTVLVELLGAGQGSTADPLTDKPLSLSLTDRFSAIVPDLILGESREGIVVSPWSTLIAARVQWDVATNPRPYADALGATTQLFTHHFGERAFLDSLPLSPTAGPTNGLSTSALHGFATTSLSAVGVDLSRRLMLTPSGLINTISLTQWLADDLRADGAFNGSGTKGPINILDDQYVDIELTRALLGAAMGSFATSTENKSGVGLGDLTAIITAMSTDTSVLYGKAAAVATSTGPGAVITIMSPTASAEYRDEVVITGKAESPIGVAGVELSLDGVPIGNGGERASTTKIVWTIKAPIEDGFHTLRVDAKDASGVASSLTVTFSSDKTAPSLLFASCKLPDDRTRGATADFATGAVTWRTVAFDASCIGPSLQPKQDDGALVFHLYAELTKTPETSAAIVLVPEDRGVVATKPHELAVHAGIYRNGKLIGTEAEIPSKGISSSGRDIAISSALFGAALLDVSTSDLLELRARVVDRQGNEGRAVYKFRLDLLPTPIAVEERNAEIPGAQRVDTFSYANNNAHQLFDAAINRRFGIYAAAKYALKNVAERPTLIKVAYSPATVTARIREWHGLVAGEITSWGMPNGLAYSTASVCAEIQEELTNPTPDEIFTYCRNEASDTVPTQGSLPANPLVLVRRNGNETCIRADDYPTFEPIEQLPERQAPWRVIVVDATSGVPMVSSSAGEYSLGAGKEAHVFIGFDVPTFDQRSLTVCTPAYVGNPPVYSSGQNPPRAPITTLVGVLPHRTVYNTAFTWDGQAYIDCSGMTCAGSDCRTAENQVLLRAQGTVFYEDTFIGSGGCYCYRRAIRRAANITLSRMRATSDVAVTGNFALTTSARLAKNPTLHDRVFDLPREAFAVDHRSRNPNQPPDHVIRYTKGLLP